MGAAHTEMKAITAKAKEEGRKLSDEELTAHADAYDRAIELHKKIVALENEAEIDGIVQRPQGQQVSLTGVPAITDKESRDILLNEVARIFTATAQGGSYDKKMQVVQDAQAKLANAGHYPKAAADAGLNTLIDPDGGIFLPTTVTEEVFRIAREYGVIARFALSLPLNAGRLKIPNILGGLKFYAVNQGSDIRVTKFTFKGLELDANKWGLIIPWTNELDSARGAQVARLIFTMLGEAFAALLDDVAFNADGTSQYHNIDGLTKLAGSAAATYVRKSSAATGRTSFAAIKGADWNAARKDVAPSLINRGIYVAHPTRQVELMDLLTDPDNSNDSKFITMVGDQLFLYGRPIYFSEAFPNTDEANAPYAAYIAGDHIAYGSEGGFVTDLLTESTLLTDSGEEVRLGSQDMRALRVKTHMDVEFSPVTVDDNGTEKGSFAVLYTAAS